MIAHAIMPPWMHGGGISFREWVLIVTVSLIGAGIAVVALMISDR